MLPRTVDKARAHLAGTLGEYIYDCPMDRRLFETLGCDAEQFLQAVRVSSTDLEVLDCLVGQRKLPKEEIDKLNEAIDNWKPTTPDGWERFKQDILRIAPGNHRIKSRTDLLDFEEGRFPGSK